MVMEPLDLDRLVESACQTSGLDDLGSPTWREGAERLVDELNHGADLSELGAVIASGDIVDYLTSRLQIVDEVKRHPEIAHREIRPPIVVLGLPRTGTTILFDLLSQDPANRAPLTWEVDRPWPPPSPDTYDTDPRIAEVDDRLAGTELLIPGFLAMHDMGARMAQECVRITAGEFRSMIFNTQYRVPAYQRWLLYEADVAPAYRYHRMFLQYLDRSRSGDRWLVKSPAHLWTLGALMREYPDALIVHTHRDPLRVVCSLASLVDLLRRLASDKVSLASVADEWVEDVAVGLDRAVVARRDGTIPGGRAVDVYFADFLADPMGVVSQIYGSFGIELTPEADRRMRDFLAENPQEKRGGHAYTFADTGLDAGIWRERMRGYQQYFNVPDEALP
jgi:hypothetical protein